MKLTRRLTIPVFIFLVLAPSSLAQELSPGEQFQAAVVAFQKSATEDNARKLAELSKQLDPAPAVPEDAEFRALKGAAFVKQAGDSAAFAKAAAEFQAASASAPWVGEYHYNLAVCEKSAGRFPAALAALKHAQIFARDAQGRRDCLVLRAELEAAQELAAAKRAAITDPIKPEESKAAALAVQAARFVGNWSGSIVSGSGKIIPISLVIKRSEGGSWHFGGDGGFQPDECIHELRLAGADLRFRFNALVGSQRGGQPYATYDIVMTVSSDGNSLSVQYIPLPPTPEERELQPRKLEPSTRNYKRQ